MLYYLNVNLISVNVMSLINAKNELENKILSVSGVSGVGASKSTNSIVVYVDTKSVCDRIPKSYNGYPVVCRVSETFSPFG